MSIFALWELNEFAIQVVSQAKHHMILAWVAHHRRRAEVILLQPEIEKCSLENERLKAELALAQRQKDKSRIIFE